MQWLESWQMNGQDWRTGPLGRVAIRFMAIACIGLRWAVVSYRLVKLRCHLPSCSQDKGYSVHQCACLNGRHAYFNIWATGLPKVIFEFLYRCQGKMGTQGPQKRRENGDPLVKMGIPPIGDQRSASARL